MIPHTIRNWIRGRRAGEPIDAPPLTEDAQPQDDQYARIRSLVRELVQSKGIELPSVPDSPGRRAYLSFLRDTGYSERELMPVIRRTHVTPEMRAALMPALLQAIQSEDKNFVKAVCWMALNTLGTGDSTEGLDDTNIIIHGLA